MDAPFRIRAGTAADAAPVAALERLCFDDPWSDESIHDSLAGGWSFGLVAVAATDGAIVGYLFGREVAGTGEVLNIATAQRWRRRGVANALLDAGLRQLRRRGATEVFLEVRASNDVAQALYQRAGFRAVGMRQGYYRHPPEDALVLRLDFDQPARIGSPDA